MATQSRTWCCKLAALHLGNALRTAFDQFKKEAESNIVYNGMLGKALQSRNDKQTTFMCPNGRDIPSSGSFEVIELPAVEAPIDDVLTLDVIEGKDEKIRHQSILNKLVNKGDLDMSNDRLTRVIQQSKTDEVHISENYLLTGEPMVVKLLCPSHSKVVSTVAMCVATRFKVDGHWCTQTDRPLASITVEA